MCQLIYHIFNDIAIYFVLVLKDVNPFPTKQKRLFQENSSFFFLISCKVLIKCTENYCRCLLHASGPWTNRVLHSPQITVVGRNMDSLIFIAKFETLQGKLLNISRCFIWASHKDFFSDNSCASPSTFCVSFRTEIVTESVSSPTALNVGSFRPFFVSSPDTSSKLLNLWRNKSNWTVQWCISKSTKSLVHQEITSIWRETLWNGIKWISN